MRFVLARVRVLPGVRSECESALDANAGRALLDRLHSAEAERDSLKSRFTRLNPATGKVEPWDPTETLREIRETCCAALGDGLETIVTTGVVRILRDRLHSAEARAVEDEQLRLRLVGDLAMEQRHHELARGRLKEVYSEMDGLRAERASVDAGVCQSCASAWWAREHDQNAAREQVAAAEAALRAERARASAAQVVTNAAVRDLTSAAGEIMLLREKLAAAEQDRDEVVTLLGEIRELARTRSQGPAVPDDLWAIKELADSFILRNAAPPGAAPAEAP